MSSGSDGHSPFRVGTLIAGLLGLGLAAWMLQSYGVGEVLAVLARAGWLGSLAIIAFHLVQMLFSGGAWRVITGAAGAAPLPLHAYIRLRWIREGVNNLLPLAQIGGEFVATRLLERRGVALAAAVAGTIADLLMEFKTQILFTVLGLALLLHYAGQSEISLLVAKGLLLASLVAAGAVIALRAGLAALMERAVTRLGNAFGWPSTARIGGLHDALQACYRSPVRLLPAGAWHLISWVLGGLEVWLILHFFGRDIGLGPASIIESLGQGSKALGFAIPGALGVQEGGYVVVCGIFGLSPEMGLALSLMKRVREVAWGAPALVVWYRAEVKAKAVVVSLGSASGGAQ
jgi:putative membrane protein